MSGRRRPLTFRRAAEGVERRLADTLVRTGLAMTPVAVGEVRRSAADGTFRLERSRLLRDLPAPVENVVVAYRHMWQGSGYRVREDDTAEATLVAEDGAEYVLTLRRTSADELLLTATSPPVRDPNAAAAPGRYARLWLAGFACGAAPQVVLMAPVVAALTGPERRMATLLAVYNLYLLPLTFVVGIGLLIRPRVRPLGAGLLTGGALGALIFAGVCAVADR